MKEKRGSRKSICEFAVTGAEGYKVRRLRLYVWQ
jgi:hypothetical protein